MMRQTAENHIRMEYKDYSDYSIKQYVNIHIFASRVIHKWHTSSLKLSKGRTRKRITTNLMTKCNYTKCEIQ